MIENERLEKWDDIGYWITVIPPRIVDRTDDRRNKDYRFKVSVFLSIWDLRGNPRAVAWMERENRSTGVMWDIPQELKVKHEPGADRAWRKPPMGFSNPITSQGNNPEDWKPVVNTKRLDWVIKVEKPSELPSKGYDELSQDAVERRLTAAYPDWKARIEKVLTAIRENLTAAETYREAEGRIREARHLLDGLANTANEEARRVMNWNERLDALCQELKLTMEILMDKEVEDLQKDPNWIKEDGSIAPIDRRVLKAVSKYRFESLPEPLNIFGRIQVQRVEITPEDVS